MKAIVVEQQTILSLFKNILPTTVENTQPSPTILICCTTQEDFLEDLVTACSETQDDAPEANDTAARFFHPTINQSLASQAIRLVFTPTVQHVRAYLAVLSVPSLNARVCVLNPISLHYGSSEFSAQGFMQTFALAVEAGARNDVKLLELCELSSEEDDGSSPWDIEVPLLSDSAELEEEEEGEMEERTVRIRRVAERWFECAGTEGDLDRLKIGGTSLVAEEDVEMEEDDMMLV